MDAKALIESFKKLADPKVAQSSQRFFKTPVRDSDGKSRHGDSFLGLRVPQLRQQLRNYASLRLTDAKTLLRSEYHEVRLFALLWLVKKFERAKTLTEKEEIYRLCVNNARYINNWDLVDSSVPYIHGPWLFGRNKQERTILYQWAESKSLWVRRTAIMATFYFIRQRDFKDTLGLSKQFLGDGEDLIHKATGWMLREVGKRDKPHLEAFLHQHYQKMPRIMLRYAIEKFSHSERQRILSGNY